MALLTPLPLHAARELCADYALDIERVEALPAGSVNSNFKLWTRQGACWFGRIYEEQAAAGAAAELELIQALVRAGLPAVAPLARNGGGFLSFYAGKPWVVFPWIEGEILCSKRVTPEHCQELGGALARLHLATPLLPRVAPGRFRIPDLRERLAAVRRSPRREFDRSADELERKLDEYAGRRDGELPSGAIHGDLFRDNVLWRDGRLIALLDFESVAWGAFTYDLMVTLLAWCYTDAFELERCAALLRGYERWRPLTVEECRALPVEAGLACLRFAVTRLTDYSLRVAPGATPVRSFARFLERLSAIETGELRSSFATLRNFESQSPAGDQR